MHKLYSVHTVDIRDLFGSPPLPLQSCNRINYNEGLYIDRLLIQTLVGALGLECTDVYISLVRVSFKVNSQKNCTVHYTANVEND